MLQDLRFAFRILRKRPTTTTVALLTLAVGVGAVTVVFSLVEAILLRPLDFPDAGRMVRLYATQEVSGGDRLRVTEGAFFDWRRRAGAFDALVAARNVGLSVTGAAQPLNPLMRMISEDYFEVLGVTPIAGRTFRREEHREGVRVAILDFGFWQSYFGGDPGVVGRSLELNNEPYEIVGVMPAGYRNPAFPDHPVLWLPLVEAAAPDRRGATLVVIGRLARGATRATAREEMDRVSEELAGLYPATDGGRGARLLGLRDSLVEGLRPALLALFGAVGFVLVLAGANVANLLLARAVGRRQELGLRLALGAGRGRLARQLLVESSVLGLGSGVLGLLLAFGAVGPLPGLAPSNLNVPLLDGVRLDFRVASSPFSRR